MMQQKKTHPELNDLSPLLQDLRQREGGFNVPEGYLDNFENDLFSKLETSGQFTKPGLQVVKKPVHKNRLLRPVMAIAATFAIILSAVWFFQARPTDTDSPEMASVELSEEDIEAYLLENVQDFEVEQLAMLPETEQPAAPSAKQPSPAKSSSDELTPEDVEHILDDMTEEELEEIL